MVQTPTVDHQRPLTVDVQNRVVRLAPHAQQLRLYISATAQPVPEREMKVLHVSCPRCGKLIESLGSAMSGDDRLPFHIDCFVLYSIDAISATRHPRIESLDQAEALKRDAVRRRPTRAKHEAHFGDAGLRRALPPENIGV